jgi:predicted methyltransferase
MADNESRTKDPDTSDANTLLLGGLGIGALGLISAAIGGAVCPVCVVAAPALLGVGAYRRWRTRAATKNATPRAHLTAAVSTAVVFAASGCGGAGAPAASAAHPAQGPLVHRFEHADHWARQFDDPSRDAWQKPADVVAAMRLSPGMRVADIGAGTGYFEPWLSRAVGPEGTVLAVDIEPDMVRHLHERAERERWSNVTSAVVTVDDPGLPSGALDRIVIVDTWHHMPAREPYARKLRDALRPGGAVFVVDFTLEASHGPPKEHRVTPEAVARELGTAGLATEILPVGLPDQYVVVGRRAN